jgi:hypothetical protein
VGENVWAWGRGLNHPSIILGRQVRATRRNGGGSLWLLSDRQKVKAQEGGREARKESLAFTG